MASRITYVVTFQVRITLFPYCTLDALSLLDLQVTQADQGRLEIPDILALLRRVGLLAQFIVLCFASEYIAFIISEFVSIKFDISIQIVDDRWVFGKVPEILPAVGLNLAVISAKRLDIGGSASLQRNLWVLRRVAVIYRLYLRFR